MSEESVNSRRCKGGKSVFFKNSFLYLFVWTGSLCVGQRKVLSFQKYGRMKKKIYFGSGYRY